jgi:chromosome segregation ATPase
MRSDVESRFTAIEKEAEMCMREKDRHEEDIVQRERTLMEDIQAIKGLKDAQTKLRCQVECLEADIRLLVHQKSKSTSRSRAEKTIQQMQESLGNHVVLGRLSELAIVESKYVTAVNSALQTELQYVVVRDREIAVSVSRAYAEKSIGRVSCCVLADFKGEYRCDPSACGLSRGNNDDDNDTVPLCQVLTCTSEPIRHVFHKFGHNWIVCKDADQAAMLSHNGSKNFVTLQGDLFFADGSIRTCRHESAKSNTNNSASLGRSGIPDSGSHQRSISELSSQLDICLARHEQGERKIQEVRALLLCAERLPQALTPLPQLTKRVQSGRYVIDASKV